MSSKIITPLDLPVKFKNRYGDQEEKQIDEIYIEELKQVQTVDGLKKFVARWENLWLIGTNPIVINLDNPEKVLDYLLDRKKIDHDCKVSKASNTELSIEVTEALNICLPYPVLDAHLVAKKFIVSFNLAFFRLYLDPFEEFDDWGR